MGDDTGSCLSNTIICGNCQVDQVCVYGTCQTCKSCHNGTLTATAASSVWGSNIQVTLVSTITGGVVNDGEWATLTTTATSITLGVSSVNSTQAGIYVKDGSTATVTGAITTRAANGGIVIQVRHATVLHPFALRNCTIHLSSLFVSSCVVWVCRLVVH
jgi:hypothetical protein